MGITTEITKRTLTDFETWSDEEIEALSLRARFNSIALILDQIKRRCPAPKNNPLEPLCPIKYRLHLDALTRISSSIRFSEHYDFEATRIVEQTLNRVNDDGKIVASLRHWKNRSDEERKNTLRKMNGHRVISTRDILKLPFDECGIKYFSRPKSKKENTKGRLTLGYYQGDFDNKDSPRYAVVNCHNDANFDNPSRASEILFHEGSHDTQLQLAWFFKFGAKDSLGKLLKDAEILALSCSFKAVISNRFRKPYNAQCHEIDAYRQDNLFSAGIQSLVAT